jgi:hypothetical protein
MNCKLLILAGSLFFAYTNAFSQQKAKKPVNPVYIDKQGVLRLSANNQEVAFYGVNYTTPFAHAYRAHKALGVDMETAIRQDVYHFARLGFDAFRVHVWDTEISDTAGNLLDNDHLRLFDFLLAELKKRNIKTIITPIAFWGNGYPERDERTPGFARKYGKGGSTINDTAIKAQENYLQQFFKHVNPYTKQTYQDDEHVIAMEINNEPSHSGPKAGVTKYINRLEAVVRSTGWTKPVFYNIAQGPFYADAVAASTAQGFSFQWYPSGLVAGRALRGNFLPHVDYYNNPFDDTIPAFLKKPLMVYEFDAADITQPVMYPAMAKSFRGAGFQWATQFAYDPLAIAYANTEYQTHYLNLAYTPAKAVSMLIAGEVFRNVSLRKSYGKYPADSSFEMFRLSYKESLSEMNSAQKFYYSGSTSSNPLNPSQLEHVAGVGNSPVVRYSGNGAYFLDKLAAGVWRLEVMPDMVPIRDPFERASPKKIVTTIHWLNNKMQVSLPDLGSGFSVKGLNEGNNFSAKADADSFAVSPGTYLLTADGRTFNGQLKGVIGLNEFVAPPPTKTELLLRHEPAAEVAAGKSFTMYVLLTDTATVTLQLNRLGGGLNRNIPMTRRRPFVYTAVIPSELLTPGQLNYRIIVQQGNDYTVYPGKVKGNPFAWDSYLADTYKTNIVPAGADIGLYNAGTDRNIFIYPSFRRNFQTSYITSDGAGEMLLRLAASQAGAKDVFGMQHFVGDKISGRISTENVFDKIIVRARSGSAQTVNARIALIDRDANSFSAYFRLSPSFNDIEIPLSGFKADSCLLLPAAYPGFQPQWFKSSGSASSPVLAEIEKIEILTGPGLPGSASENNIIVEIESVRIGKRK